MSDFVSASRGSSHREAGRCGRVTESRGDEPATQGVVY